MNTKWIVDGRFRIPIWWSWAMCIPQPRFLKRWYYQVSYYWWGHPSNYHWKGWLIGRGCDGYNPTGFRRWLDKKCSVLPGERDLWSGEYCYGESEGYCERS